VRRSLETANRRTQGVASITVLVSLVALIALASLAIDVGLIWTSRNQVQNAVDAAALAGAGNMIDVATPATTLPQAEAAVLDQAGDHSAVPTSSLAIQSSDIRFGDWDFTNRVLDTSVNLADPSQVTAVEVTGRLDGAVNDPVPSFMARILGRNSFSVTATATAYLGFAGRVNRGEIDLPIGIDCCKLRGPECQYDYCDTITNNPPNPCTLYEPQDEGAATVSCLEFHNTEEQNACWTLFDGYSPSINTSDLIDIVENGNPEDIGYDDVYQDNGDKTPVIQEIYDRFKGEGSYVGNADGVDRYAPIYDPADPDSWVVGLPVMECQTDDHCAKGLPAAIVGFVCFEIREITVTPDKIIRGRFLCASDPLYDDCDIGLTGSGGFNFDIRADLPVLVR
jgi:Flp pilus assembly protein TadG